MAGPVEFRFYHQKFTLEHARAGIAPLRDQTTAGVELYLPAAMQYRYKMRVTDGGKVDMIW